MPISARSPVGAQTLEFGGVAISLHALYVIGEDAVEAELAARREVPDFVLKQQPSCTFCPGLRRDR